MNTPAHDTTSRMALVGAEAGLLVLALGTAASFTRLFLGWSWLGRLAVPITVGWLIGLIGRRLGAGVRPAIALQTVASVLVLSWIFAPGTLAVVLPTPATWTTLIAEVRESFASFSELVAPVPATNGFLFVIAVALWIIGTFADVASMRFRAPVQAAVPYVSTFAVVGILARGSGRTTSAALFASALAVYAVTQQVLSASGHRWVAGHGARGTRAVLGAASVVALIAVAGGLVVGPRLPGSVDPVVDLRDLGRGTGPRTVVSPFVGIRSLLGERSDQVMFTVRASEPSYWRLTSLEEYDPVREIWVSRGSYQRTDGELPPTIAADITGRDLLQEYRVKGLATLWLPAAFEPLRVSSPVDVSFDTVSSSLILRDRSDATDLTYRLESKLPDLAPLVTAGPAPLTTDVDPDYIADPQLGPARLGEVNSIVAGAQDPYQQMLALQNWFRDEFTYDDEVDFSQEPDALDAFISARRGFCQQFASTFALYARALGVPSRVAVGFTPGDPVASDATGSGLDGQPAGVEYVVRGRHAHAWPEVYFEGIGWVPFEPTPQRGNPQTQDYTGVAADQADAPPRQAATTTIASVPTSSTPSAPTTDANQLDATAAPQAADGSNTDGNDGWLLGLVFVVVAVALVAGLAIVAARRRPGRARRASGAQRRGRGGMGRCRPSTPARRPATLRVRDPPRVRTSGRRDPGRHAPEPPRHRRDTTAVRARHPLAGSVRGSTGRCGADRRSRPGGHHTPPAC